MDITEDDKSEEEKTETELETEDVENYIEESEDEYNEPEVYSEEQEKDVRYLKVQKKSITSNVLTIYEKSSLIGTRAKHLDESRVPGEIPCFKRNDKGDIVQMTMEDLLHV